MEIKNDDNLLHSFINDFAESRLSTAELQALSELKDKHSNIRKMAHSGLLVHMLLRQAPKVRARKGFDQRMSALFALEIEKELNRQNAANLYKNQNAEALD